MVKQSSFEGQGWEDDSGEAENYRILLQVPFEVFKCVKNYFDKIQK